MTATTYDHYPQNVGILAMEMYFPSRVCLQLLMATVVHHLKQATVRRPDGNGGL